MSRLWAHILYFEPPSGRAARVKVLQLLCNLIETKLQRPGYLIRFLIHLLAAEMSNETCNGRSC